MSSKTLWIGDVEPWMDEIYYSNIFNMIAPVKSIKIMKKGGVSIGYGFVEFESEEISSYVLNNFNGKEIYGSKPLKLSRSQFNITKLGGEEFQIYVCDMCQKVTEDILFDFFKSKYPSVLSAKIIFDNTTKLSRGYGFVKFSSREESEKAVSEMNGQILIDKAIRVK